MSAYKRVLIEREGKLYYFIKYITHPNSIVVSLISDSDSLKDTHFTKHGTLYYFTFIRKDGTKRSIKLKDNNGVYGYAYSFVKEWGLRECARTKENDDILHWNDDIMKHGVIVNLDMNTNTVKVRPMLEAEFKFLNNNPRYKKIR